MAPPGPTPASNPKTSGGTSAPPGAAARKRQGGAAVAAPPYSRGIMRVVAGQLKGRPLRAVPGKATRPTSDRVREALFSVLGERVEGARVLDLFAGTGALAIEALSRGARAAVLVEQAAPAAAVIRANLQALALSTAAVVRRTRAEHYLRTLPPEGEGGPFELVFLDPPYALPVGVLAGVLARLAEGGLSDRAVVVVESSARSEAPPWPAAFQPEPPRRYGDTALHLATFRATLASDPPSDPPSESPAAAEGGRQP